MDYMVSTNDEKLLAGTIICNQQNKRVQKASSSVLHTRIPHYLTFNLRLKSYQILKKKRLTGRQSI